jgi:DNA-binding NtrC family response regulator
MARVLIVEDEYFIADDCATLMHRSGLDVIGPVATVEDGLALIGDADAALVDINLGGQSSYPLLEQLVQRAIPTVIYTGYERLPQRYAHLPFFPKPFSCQRAVDHIRNCVD